MESFNIVSKEDYKKITPAGVLGIIFVKKSYPQNKVYMFKTINEAKILDFFDHHLENILNIAFLSGVKQVEIINTSADKFVKNLELLLLNKDILYISSDLSEISLLNKLSLVVEEQGRTLGIVPDLNFLKEENIAYENIVLSGEEIGFNDDKDSFYTAVLIGGVLTFSKSIFNDFLYTKINLPIRVYGEKNSSRNIVNITEAITPYIKEIITSTAVPAEVIVKKAYVKAKIKSKLNDIFKNRQATLEKVNSVKTQTKIILDDFKNKDVIKDYCINNISYEKSSEICSVDLDLIIKNDKKDLKFPIKLLI